MPDEKASQAQSSSPERTGRPAATRLGPSVVVQGDIEAHEDILIEGRLNGKVTLPSGTLTVAKGARVEGDIKVRTLVLHGELAGNVEAGERVQIFDTAWMNGDVAAAKITIADGARFTGGIRTGARP